jgi:hypothetical protein
MGDRGRYNPDIAPFLHVTIKRDKYLFQVTMLPGKIDRHPIGRQRTGKALRHHEKRE